MARPQPEIPRREDDLAPKTEPTVISNPSPRDVVARKLMVDVLEELRRQTGEDLVFIPSLVMQGVAAVAFDNYSAPGVGVSKMRYKGYVKNVAGARAVWRLDSVELGDVVIPDEMRLRDGIAAEIVRNARAAEPEAFEEGIAMALDGRYAPYRPVEDHVLDADRSPYSATGGDSDSGDDEDADNDVEVASGGGDMGSDEDESVREGAPVAPQPVVIDEGMVEQIVSRLLDARAAQQEPPPAPVSEARIAEMIDQAVRKVQVPAPTLNQSVVDDTVQNALSRLMPSAAREMQSALQAMVAQTVDELGRQRATHEQRLAALRKELEDAERAARDASLRQEAAKLVAQAVGRLTKERQK